MLRKLSTTIALLFVVSGAGCLGGGPGTSEPNPDPVPSTGDPNPQPSGDTLGIAPGSPTSSADPDNTFDHMNENDVDPFAVLGRIQEQGPPEISTKMHSCQKLKYATLGRLLTQLGVNLARNAAAGQPQSAGQLYRGGAQALGAPNYGARISEAIELTTSGATKLFDIFVQAAPEIITAMPTNQAAQVNGTATNMFDAQGRCTMEGIAFIQGSPASQAQKDLCDQVINQASSQTIGRTIAVATILSAAHTCE
jgi:hypothetical protein